MSSPLNKTSSKRKNEETLIGYAQDVSEVKRSRSNTTDYVTMRIQTSPVKTCQALLYSPQKRKICVHSQQMKTPIKIKDFARTNDDKIVVNDMTYVGQPTAGEYSFQYAEVPEKKQIATNIIDILNEGKEWDRVSLKAEAIQVRSKKLKLAVATVADSTALIPLDIWEEHIQSIEIGKVYLMEPLQVRIWSNKKKLATQKKTNITQIKEDQELNDVEIQTQETTEPQETIMVKRFKRIQKFDKFSKCPDCSRRLPGTCQDTVKCEQCGTMRSDECSTGITAKIIVMDDQDNKLSVKMGDQVLGQLVDNILNQDEQTLAQKLLFVENVSITYNKDTLIGSIYTRDGSSVWDELGQRSSSSSDNSSVYKYGQTDGSSVQTNYRR